MHTFNISKYASIQCEMQLTCMQNQAKPAVGCFSFKHSCSGLAFELSIITSQFPLQFLFSLNLLLLCWYVWLLLCYWGPTHKCQIWVRAGDTFVDRRLLLLSINYRVPTHKCQIWVRAGDLFHMQGRVAELGSISSGAK